MSIEDFFNGDKGAEVNVTPEKGEMVYIEDNETVKYTPCELRRAPGFIGQGAEDTGVDRMHLHAVGNFLAGRFKESVTRDVLKDSLLHYAAELDGQGFQSHIGAKLREFATKAKGDYDHDQNVLKDVVKFLDSLRVQQKGA